MKVILIFLNNNKMPLLKQKRLKILVFLIKNKRSQTGFNQSISKSRNIILENQKKKKLIEKRKSNRKRNRKKQRKSKSKPSLLVTDSTSQKNTTINLKINIL